MKNKYNSLVIIVSACVVGLIMFVTSMYYLLGTVKQPPPNKALEDVMSNTVILQTLADQVSVEYDVEVVLKKEKGTDYTYLYDSETGQLKKEVADYLLQLKSENKTIDVETLQSLISSGNLKTKEEMEKEKIELERKEKEKLNPPNNSGLNEIIQTPQATNKQIKESKQKYDEVTLEALLAELQ